MMEPHMIENYIIIVFVIVVNHVGFRIRIVQISDFVAFLSVQH